MTEMSCDKVKCMVLKLKRVSNSTFIANFAINNDPKSFLNSDLDQFTYILSQFSFYKNYHEHFVHGNHLVFLVNVDKLRFKHKVFNLNHSWNSIFLFALLRRERNYIVVLKVRYQFIKVPKAIYILTALVPSH
jgi:hypothetical protein